MFKVFFGSTRCVVAFPFFGFVLKFPSFHKSNWVWYYLNKDPFLEVVSSFLNQSWQLTISGVAQNIRERALWKKTKDPFLVQTYFSFLGLVNVQKYRNSAQGKELELLLLTKMGQLMESTLDSGVWVEVSTHSWSGISNFTVTPSGNLQMLDYGSENDDKVILALSTKLQAIKLQYD